jgi:ribosomal protein S18 acetylase RimI-like enzyme
MAALSHPDLPDVVELSSLSTKELDGLFQEEIGVWHRRFAWDFRPSADLLRRFIHLHSLIGYALRTGGEVVGYAYCVCEGRKGLIGDFYLREGYADQSNEALLLGTVVEGLIRTAGVRRIESQLMMLQNKAVSFPFTRHLSRHDRFFMDLRTDSISLQEKSPSFRAKFRQWTERFQEETAHLVVAAYRGHVDSEINDQYRTIPGARHFLTNIIRYPGCGLFSPEASCVAVDDNTGKACGACLASMVSANSGHITQLCVLPAIRGAHVGYELLRRSLLRLKGLGCTSVSLTVTCSNTQAVRLYESVGFRKQSTFPALIWEGF